MKNNIDWKEIVLQWLDGISNEHLMRMTNIKTLPKLYHHLRGFLFAVAKENPKAMKELVERSTGKWNKKIMETAQERLRLQLSVMRKALTGQGFVSIALDLKMSYPKVKKLFKEFIDNDDEALFSNESDNFILANYHKELYEKVRKYEDRWMNENKKV